MQVIRHFFNYSTGRVNVGQNRRALLPNAGSPEVRVFRLCRHGGPSRRINDIRKDDLGLALTEEHQPKRGRTYKTTRNKSVGMPKATADRPDDIDPDGIAF